MPDLASITLPNNVTYNFKDEAARNLIPTYFNIIYDFENNELVSAPSYTAVHEAYSSKPLVAIKLYEGYYDDNEELKSYYIGEALLSSSSWEEIGENDELISITDYTVDIWAMGESEYRFKANWYGDVPDENAEINYNRPIAEIYNSIPQSSTNDASDIPKMDGTAARGSSLRYARADHVHPSDTSRAAKTTVPTQASISSAGLITFKNSSNSSLFTLQLPLYNGGMS
jgi:hypothetical protein